MSKIYPHQIHWRIWMWLRAWAMIGEAIIDIVTLTFVSTAWSTRIGCWVWTLDDYREEDKTDE